MIKRIVGFGYKMIPSTIRYGKVYTNYRKLLVKSKSWTKKDKEEYQWTKIERILDHAYHNIPYYRKLFNNEGINLKQIQNFNDFKKIPYLTKESIRNNFKDLIATNYKKSDRLYVKTGGSTGMPLQICYQKGVSRSIEHAFITKLWSSIGYKENDKIAVLRGNVVRGANNEKISDYEPIKNRMILSSFHMTDETLPCYIKEIKKFKPKYLHVYPSSLTIIAKYILENRYELPPIKAILSSSETLYEWQKELFKKAFNCKVFSWYGQTEMCVLAGNCKSSDNFYSFPEYSYVELVDNNDRELKNEDETGEVIGTNFNNYVMPLIRYRTMDYATLTEEKCECHKNHKAFKKIIGREQDFFVDETGILVSSIYSDFPLWELMKNVNAYQYIQEIPGRLKLTIDVKNKINQYEFDIIKNRFLKYYPRFKIEICTVNDIKRTSNGKFKYLIQRIPIDISKGIKVPKIQNL